MLTQLSNPTIAAEISARLDRLPATRYIWKLVLLLSLGGCFEMYDLFFTAYIGPGLVRSGLFSSSSASFFGFNGLASFVAATFAGLFIGTMLFGEFTHDFGGNQPTLEDALGLVLASLSLLGLGIFGPGIATGLTAGAPQLGAGAAVGTAQAIGGAAIAGAVGARAGLAVLGGAARAISPLARGGTLAAASGKSAEADGPPAWARRMGRAQKIKQGISTAAQVVRSGDHAGGSSSVPLSEDR